MSTIQAARFATVLNNDVVFIWDTAGLVAAKSVSGSGSASNMLPAPVAVFRIVPWKNSKVLAITDIGLFYWDGDFTHTFVPVAVATQTTANFTQPGANGNVTISVLSTTAMYQGQVLNISTAGNFIVISILGPTSVIVQNNGDAGNAAINTVILSPQNVITQGVPASGIDIAVFAGRVWIIKGRVAFFSSVDDFLSNAWLTQNGSASVNFTDNTLRGDLVRLIAANAYLYFFGPSSIDIIADVRVPASANPPTPIFTKANLTAIIGTQFPDSVTLLERSVCFANSYGFWSLDGLTTSRISLDIDDTVHQINFANQIWAASATINNVLSLVFLFSWFDPLIVGGGTRQIMACWFDDKWFFSSVDDIEGTMFTFVAESGIVSGFTNNLPCAFAWGTLNDSGATSAVVTLFTSTTTEQNYAMRTALWDEGSSIVGKQALKVGVEYTLQGAMTGTVVAPITGPGNPLPTGLGALTITIDNENGSSDPIALTTGTAVTWINQFGATVTWVNITPVAVTWFTPLIGKASYSNCTQSGKYIGMEMTCIGGQGVFNSFDLEYENRESW